MALQLTATTNNSGRVASLMCPKHLICDMYLHDALYNAHAAQFTILIVSSTTAVLKSYVPLCTTLPLYYPAAHICISVQ
eukprot:20603-Heterococcus_DN1.PRE.1